MIEKVDHYLFYGDQVHQISSKNINEKAFEGYTFTSIRITTENEMVASYHLVREEDKKEVVDFASKP